MTANEYGVSIWGVERALEPDGGEAAQHCECPGCHCTCSWQKAGQWLTRGGVEGEGWEGVITEMQEETTQGDGDGYVPYLDGGDGLTVYAHVKTYPTVHLTYVWLIVHP